ncbi:MAG: DUF4835 family protein [Chitinophagales bacterium]|nr:DUF4835 family protein [Chitinophagales bacterium]
MKNIAFLFFFCCLWLNSQAQEINAKVTIQAINLQLVDQRVFKTLEKDVRDFINNRRWTDDNYKPEERIDCNILITITKEISNTRFEANFAIQSLRPVFNSNYNSTVFSFQDKGIQFDYAENDPVQFNDQSYTSEISSVIAYYVYIVLGLDGDTFAPNGGSGAFSKAQQVVSNAQTSPFKGWKGFDSNRNRYWLIDNLLSSRFVKMRQAYYQYHRLGLDNMFNNPTEGRSNVINALAMMEKIRKDNASAMATDIFINTKPDEVIGIFGGASVPPGEKQKAVTSMSAIDPANQQRYMQINNVTGGGGLPSDAEIPDMLGRKRDFEREK